MIDHVIAGLRESRITETTAVVSPATPETAAWLADQEIRIIETPGDGYVADLTAALKTIETPVVTVTADLPLVTGRDVDRAIETAAGDSLAVCVPLSSAERIGTSADTTVDHDGETVVPTGLNVVGDGRSRRVVWQTERLAVNVNRPVDLRCAEKMLADS